LELSKFFWVMKTFTCNFGANVFAWLFELIIEPDIIKLDDGQHYEAHYTCCTFNMRRQNTRKELTWIQIAPCCKTNFSEDWSSYWFYVKVDMSKMVVTAAAAVTSTVLNINDQTVWSRYMQIWSRNTFLWRTYDQIELVTEAPSHLVYQTNRSFWS
jgi:hypothetical protein